MWRAVAELLAGGGFDQLPPSAKMAIVVGALVGVCLPLLGKLLPKAAPYLPSAMGLGLSWVMVYSNCQAFAIGAVIVWIWTKLHARTADGYSVALASGSSPASRSSRPSSQWRPPRSACGRRDSGGFPTAGAPLPVFLGAGRFFPRLGCGPSAS